MPLSTDIRLPRSHVPKFPDRCLVCGQEQPNATDKVRVHVTDWSVITMHPHHMHEVEVPVSFCCVPRLHRRRNIEWLLIIGGVIALTILLWPVIMELHQRLPAGLDHFVFLYVVGVALVFCLIPWIACQVIFPAPFDVLAGKHSVLYQFRDPEYAGEFLALNSPPTQA